MLIAPLLAAAIIMPMKFDLVCVGQNSFLGFKDQKSIPYQDRFSIDLKARVYSNSDHVNPKNISAITDQIVFIDREFGSKKASSYIAVDRFDGNLTGETDYGDGHKIELRAECKIEPFTHWDHRAF